MIINIYESSSSPEELLFLFLMHFLVIFSLQFAMTRDKLGGHFEIDHRFSQ